MTSKPVDLPADLASAYLALLSEREMLQAERDVVDAERDTVVAERDIAVAQAANAQAMLSDSAALIAKLELAIEKLRRELRGKRSERTARLLDQMELQLEELVMAATEDEVAAQAAAAKTASVRSFTRKDDGERNPQGSPRNRRRPKKTNVALDLSSEGNFGMRAVCETLGVARSNIAARATASLSRARGRPPLPDRELVADIEAIIADMPTYGYRRVHAILRRNARKEGRSWPNAKRVYRVMKLHNLLLVRHTGAVDDRLHNGQVAVERSNIRWCSDGFEIGCDKKEKVRVAFALDCCDREAIARIATTQGIKSQDLQDLVITAVENRFGRINMLSEPIEWLTDNGSCFIARGTASLLRDIGMEPCTTPVRSPQSNGMAEAFVKTFKRDYVAVSPTPDAETVMAQLPFWF